jgi:two-component system, NtrC family, response regulator HydG
MRRLLLVESAPGSLEGCASLLRAHPELELRSTPLAGLGAAMAAHDTSLVLLDAGSSTPEEVSPPLGDGPSSMERVVVVGGHQLQPAWVHRWLRAGAHEVIPCSVDQRELERTLERAWALQHDRTLAAGGMRPAQVGPHGAGFHRLLSRNAVYLRLLARAQELAGDDRPLLLWGEPGTGKATIAESIHMASLRSRRPFVRVTARELAALLAAPSGEAGDGTAPGAPRLLEERLRVASGGSLLVSRLEELSVPAQGRLLRDLIPAARPFTRDGWLCAGGLRVMATVRRSLAADMRRGVYRADVYHRLGLELLHLPPLRERREDIDLLAQRSLRGWSTERGVESIATDALELLRAYDYPCNISELESIMELALRTERSNVLAASSLPGHLRQASAADQPAAQPDPTWRTLEEVQADYTRQVLEHTRGNRSEAARILGISRTGLLCKIRRYGINSPPGDQGGQHER